MTEKVIDLRTTRRARTALLLVGMLLAAALAVVMIGGTTASAAPNDPYTPTDIVSPTRIHGPGVEDEVLPNRITRKHDRLPFTGADLTLFAATGMAAIGTGVIIVRRTRSRKSES